MKPSIVALCALLIAPTLLIAGCGNDTQLTPDTTAPLAPVLEGANSSQDVVGMWWRPNTEADLDGYFVYLVVNGAAELQNERPITDNFATITITDGTRPLVYVTAVDLSGNESNPSAQRRPENLDADNANRPPLKGTPISY